MLPQCLVPADLHYGWSAGLALCRTRIGPGCLTQQATHTCIETTTQECLVLTVRKSEFVQRQGLHPKSICPKTLWAMLYTYTSTSVAIVNMFDLDAPS